VAQVKVPEPRVAPRGLPAAYDTKRTPDVGATIQRGYQQLGASVQQAGRDVEVGYEHKRRADAVKVNDQLNELQRGGTDELYGTPEPSPEQAAEAAFEGRDPKAGYLSTKGTAAAEHGTGAYERLEQRREKLLESLGDDDQKELFKKQSDRLLQQWYGQIEQHTFHQNEQARVDSLKNSVDEAKRVAALNPADDKQAMNSIGRIVGLQDHFATSTQDALVEATRVQGEITAARLDALLVQEGGFADAERVYQQNKGALGTRADEYAKKISDAKLGGRAAVEAHKAVVRAGSSSSKPFALPNADLLERELEKLAVSDPKLYEKTAPIARARLAMQREYIKQQKEEFVDSAVSVYNKNHATFFSSPLAEQLNQVDPDKYKALWNETLARSRSAGDDSPAARRAQKAADDLALRKYRSYGDGDISARVGLNPETFVAGMNVSDMGLERIRNAHAGDVAAHDKGLAEAQKQFVSKTRGQLQAWAPDPGTSKQSKAAARAWWEEKTAEAVNAYTDWANNNPTKKAPSREEADEMRARIILDNPVDPSRPRTLEENAAAVRELATPKKKSPQGMVTITGPKGQKGKAPAEGLDAWLAAHPDWTRQ
jgi:hypothetical protein